MIDTQLEKIKRRLGITDTDTQQDDLIRDLINDAESYFKVLTGADVVGEKYDFIIRDVALKLYARKGSEGTTSESVDGYSVSYTQSLFDEYLDLLNRDFNLDGTSMERKGRVIFY